MRHSKPFCSEQANLLSQTSHPSIIHVRCQKRLRWQSILKFVPLTPVALQVVAIIVVIIIGLHHATKLNEMNEHCIVDERKSFGDIHFVADGQEPRARVIEVRIRCNLISGHE